MLHGRELTPAKESLLCDPNKFIFLYCNYKAEQTFLNQYFVTVVGLMLIFMQKFRYTRHWWR